MKRHLALPILLAGLMLSGVQLAYGAEDQIFKEISHYQQTSDSRVSVCGTEYTIGFKDKTYSAGVDAVHMHIASFASPGKFLTFVKIGFGTFGTKSFNRLAPLPIANVSLMLNGQTYKVKRTQCEDDTATFCGGFGGDEAGYVASFLQFPNAELVFNQKAGALDYHIDISTDIPSETDTNKIQKHIAEEKNHSQCLVGLLEENNSH